MTEPDTGVYKVLGLFTEKKVRCYQLSNPARAPCRSAMFHASTGSSEASPRRRDFFHASHHGHPPAPSTLTTCTPPPTCPQHRHAYIRKNGAAWTSRRGARGDQPHRAGAVASSCASPPFSSSSYPPVASPSPTPSTRRMPGSSTGTRPCWAR